ncbi:MAG: MBL fold metallo-hydrolase, partial [Rhizobiaceae bacterium]
MKTPKFDTVFEPHHGQAVQVADDVFRVTAPNRSPYTFHGTNSYLVGRSQLAVVDPGPDDQRHFDALMDAIGGRAVSHIFVTHTHMDHSPLAKKLREKTGALTVAFGPHARARSMSEGEQHFSDASCDLAFQPDVCLQHDGVVTGDEWSLRG